MSEPRELREARRHLSQAEAAFRTQEGLTHLEEALALLEEVTFDGEDLYRAIAANLLNTYSGKICASVRALVEGDRALPEPELEHVFKVLLAFDSASLELPDYVRTLKVDVVRRLVERYYEGYPEADKEAALRKLAGIAGD